MKYLYATVVVTTLLTYWCLILLMPVQEQVIETRVADCIRAHASNPIEACLKVPLKAKKP